MNRLKIVVTSLFLLSALCIVAATASACVYSDMRGLSKLINSPDNYDAYEFKLGVEVEGGGQTTEASGRVKVVTRKGQQLAYMQTTTPRQYGSDDITETYCMGEYVYTEKNGKNATVTTFNDFAQATESSGMMLLDIEKLQEIDPTVTYDRSEKKYTVVVNDTELSQIISEKNDIIGMLPNVKKFSMFVWKTGINELDKMEIHVQFVNFYTYNLKISIDMIAHGRKVQIEVPEAVQAAIGNSESGLSYQLNEDGQSYQVSALKQLTGEVVIPSAYSGKPVTAIKSEGFFNQTMITSVTIPHSIETIGTGAFRGCTALKKAILGEGVAIVGDSAFMDCTSLNTVVTSGSFAKMGSLAFYNTEIMESSDTTDGIVYAGNWAISQRSTLPPLVRIKPDCTLIASDALGGSEVELIVPISVVRIDFYAIRNLRRIYYLGTSAQWNDIDVNKDDYAFDSFIAIPYYYSEIKPSDFGNYWHYAEDGVTPLVW